MNIVHFGEGSCEKIRRYLDSYVSSELLVETNHEVLRHLEQCSACAEELEVRTRLRARLKSAVDQMAAPPELAVKIREQIGRGQARTRFGADWARWAVAAAAVLVISVGTWTIRFRQSAVPDLTDRHSQDAFIQRISEAVPTVLRVGLGDHVHCTVFRRYPKNPPTPEEMARSLGPAYQGLLPVVRAAIPARYRIIMAHQCGYSGRRFVHVTFRDGSDLVSLVIARKQPGESLAAMAPASQPSGIRVYQSAERHFTVAGFESGDFLAFVVSDLSSRTNLQVADNLAPGVHAFLTAKAQG